MVYSSVITLDGIANGIGAYVMSKNEFVKREGGKTLFGNFKALECRLRELDVDYHDVKICFLVHDKITGKASIQLSECYRIEGGWRCVRDEYHLDVKYTHMYDIMEKEIDVVETLGYISTKDSGTHDPNKEAKFEYVKLKNIRYKASKTAYELAAYPTYGINIVKNNFGIDINIEGTTAVVHVWTISKLMDYNTVIKKKREKLSNVENKDRCLPFVNGKDKYGSLYVFTTVDRTESRDESVKEKIENFLKIYITYMQDLYPNDEVVYENLEFNGEIIISREVIKNNDHNYKNGSK